MINSLAADLVVLLHFAFVLFAAAGGILAIKWLHLAWLHIPALAWAVWIELTGGICPLTPLEQSLRQKGGQVSYTGSFIDHYIDPILYPKDLSQTMQWWLAAAVLALNILIYLLAWLVRRRKK